MRMRTRYAISWGFLLVVVVLTFKWPWAANEWHGWFLPACIFVFQVGLTVVDHYITKYRRYLGSDLDG